jgi:hypothetical protein
MPGGRHRQASRIKALLVPVVGRQQLIEDSHRFISWLV